MTEADFERAKSKSQRKREHHSLQDLGESLVELSPRQLKRIPLSDHAREEIVATRTLQRGARQRQLRYLAGVLEHEDGAAIRNALEVIYGPIRAGVRTLHEIEQLRDDVLRHPDEAIERLSARFVTLDTLKLRQLALDAERTGPSGRKAMRAIYQYLALTLQSADRGEVSR